MRSEIAQIKQQIIDEYLAGQRGLAGLACGAARHEFITRRMENMCRCQQELETLIGQEQTRHIMIETFAALS